MEGGEVGGGVHLAQGASPSLLPALPPFLVSFLEEEGDEGHVCREVEEE